MNRRSFAQLLALPVAAALGYRPKPPPPPAPPPITHPPPKWFRPVAGYDAWQGNPYDCRGHSLTLADVDVWFDEARRTSGTYRT